MNVNERERLISDIRTGLNKHWEDIFRGNGATGDKEEYIADALLAAGWHVECPDYKQNVERCDECGGIKPFHRMYNCTGSTTNKEDEL